YCQSKPAPATAVLVFSSSAAAESKLSGAGLVAVAALISRGRTFKETPRPAAQSCFLLFQLPMKASFRNFLDGINYVDPQGENLQRKTTPCYRSAVFCFFSCP